MDYDPNNFDGLGMQEQKRNLSSDELYSSELQQEKIRNIISQISPENQLQEIEMRLKGYRKNFETGEWEKIADRKRISDLLISRYMGYLSSLMSLNTTMSNLSPPQINLLMKRIIEWVTDDLDANAEKYGFEDDYTERTRVGEILIRTSFLVLNRCLNGSEARRLFKAMNITESNRPMNEGGKGNSWWEFWKK